MSYIIDCYHNITPVQVLLDLITYKVTAVEWKIFSESESGGGHTWSVYKNVSFSLGRQAQESRSLPRHFWSVWTTIGLCGGPTAP